MRPNFEGKNLKTPSRTIKNPHPTKPLSSTHGLRNRLKQKNQSAPPVHTKIKNVSAKMDLSSRLILILDFTEGYTLNFFHHFVQTADLRSQFCRWEFGLSSRGILNLESSYIGLYSTVILTLFAPRWGLLPSSFARPHLETGTEIRNIFRQKLIIIRKKSYPWVKFKVSF